MIYSGRRQVSDINYFISLTEEQIMKGLDAIHDKEYAVELLTHDEDSAIVSFFMLDTELQRIGFKWLECGRDKVLLKLTYTPL